MGIKLKNFEWTSSYFENINTITLKFACKLFDMNFIKEVYLDENNNVCITHNVICEGNFIGNLTDENANNSANLVIFRIPINFTVDNKTGCINKEKNNCEFYGCPIVVAGYIYHQKINLGSSKEFNPDKIKKEVLKLEKKSEIKFDDLKAISEEELTLINNIKDSLSIPFNVKEEFLKLIKSFINLNDNDINNNNINTNFIFMENSDSLNKICKGQQNCIDILSKILNTFGYINNKSIKYVDLKELTIIDELTEENYKADIIVINNIYCLLQKQNIGSPEQIERKEIIKNNLPSYISNNTYKKTFIICDKEANIRNLFSYYNSLSLLFNTQLIEDLSLKELKNLLIKTYEKNNIKINNNFKTDIDKYLELNYMYSPFKNFEFIDYIYKDSLKNTFITNHPNEVHLEDLHIFKLEKNDDMKSLDALVGLDNVKREIINLKEYLLYEKDKKAKNEDMPNNVLHMIFLGNPGTGKTTVARLMAGILFDLGYIRYNKCIEVESKDLIASVMGATSIKTYDKIQEAMGGVLFIDEAYAITESAYGNECIASLIKSMEDYRDDIVIILAGYKDEMTRFIEVNPGFKSRVPYIFEFADYSNEELITMTENLLRKYGFEMENTEVLSRFNKKYESAKQRNSKDFGNSRFVRQTVEEVLRLHAVNTLQETDLNKKYHLISVSDVKTF